MFGWLAGCSLGGDPADTPRSTTKLPIHASSRAVAVPVDPMTLHFPDEAQASMYHAVRREVAWTDEHALEVHVPMTQLTWSESWCRAVPVDRCRRGEGSGRTLGAFPATGDSAVHGLLYVAWVEHGAFGLDTRWALEETGPESETLTLRFQTPGGELVMDEVLPFLVGSDEVEVPIGPASQLVAALQDSPEAFIATIARANESVRSAVRDEISSGRAYLCQREPLGERGAPPCNRVPLAADQVASTMKRVELWVAERERLASAYAPTLHALVRLHLPTSLTRR